VIRNSEGTRTGDKLAITAWWLSLVLGLCYLAYLFGVDYSIRRDARLEVERWMGYIQEEKTGRAFVRTLPPGARQAVSPDDTTALRGRFRDDLLAFQTCDLMKLAQRNKGAFNFTQET